MVCSMTRGPGKPDQRAWFSDVQIAQHREACRDASGSGVGQHSYIRKPASSSLCSAAEILASCIRLIVPSCMRAPPEQIRSPAGFFRQGSFNRAGDFFADHRTHRAADESQLERADIYAASQQ